MNTFWALLLLVWMTSLQAFGQLPNTSDQYYNQGNDLKNPGWEQGRTVSNWIVATTSGSATYGTSTTTYPGGGARSGELVMTSWVGTLCQTVPNGSAMYQDGVASMLAQTDAPAGTSQICALVDSVEQTCNSFGKSATQFLRQDATYIAGATNSAICFKQTTAYTGTVRFDGARHGVMPVGYIQSVSSVRRMGVKVVGGASGGWSSLAATASMQLYSANASSNNPTVYGGAIAPVTKIPAVTLPKGTVGRTDFFVKADTYSGVAASTDVECEYELFDGTNSIPIGAAGLRAATGAGSMAGRDALYFGSTEIATQLAADTQYAVRFRQSAGTPFCQIINDQVTKSFEIAVVNYPPSSQSFTGGKCDNPINCETDFSLISTITTLTSTNVAGWSAAPTNPSAGRFVYNITGAGFTVPPSCQCTSVFGSGQDVTCQIRNNTTTTQVEVGVTNGSNGEQNGTAVHLTCSRQGADYYRAKILNIQASLTGLLKAPGTSRPKTCYMMIGGAGSITSPTNCTSSPCTEYSDTCGTLSVTRGSTGQYVVVGAAGTCKGSDRLSCYIVPDNGANEIKYNYNPNAFATAANGGFSWSYVTQNNASTNVDTRQSVKCECEEP